MDHTDLNMLVLLHHNTNKLFAVREPVNFLSLTIEIENKCSVFFCFICIQKYRDKSDLNHLLETQNV